MPTFPDTYAGGDGRGAAAVSAAQTQYWSLVSCESVPSGQVVDGLTDFQIPLDKDRNYTIVMSRSEDRPANAKLANGVAWIQWSPRGEGIDDTRNRPEFGMLILRVMGNEPDWKERPDNIIKPGTGDAAMGLYFPTGYYTTKAEFETRGLGNHDGNCDDDRPGQDDDVDYAHAVQFARLSVGRIGVQLRRARQRYLQHVAVGRGEPRLVGQARP